MAGLTREELESRSTEELEELLREDFYASDEPDLELVLPILEILREREEPERQEAEVDRAWKKFQERYQGRMVPAGERPKKKRRRVWRGLAAAAAVLVLTVLLAVPVAGYGNVVQMLGQRQSVESEQIRGCAMSAQAGENGEILVQFFVEGEGTVTRLGAEEVLIQRKDDFGQDWVEVIRYDAACPGMQAEGQGAYENTMVYTGWAGTEYRITLTVFAENDKGYDSRTEIFFVTAE